jgi:gluconate 5-dehydrogenase
MLCIMPDGLFDLPGRTDLVGALVFLASSASDFVIGQALYVDGGMTAVV